MSKKIFILSLIIIIFGGVALYFFTFFKPGEVPTFNINNFEECVSAGYPVLESYPRQCKTPEGKTFTEDIGNELEKSDLIKTNTPRPNQAIQSPIVIEGEARGLWFFEASFPVKLLDGNGNLIATTIAQAQGDWVTEDFVPFEAELHFELPVTEKGTLILEKDNPSGLPENADELRIPVKFKVGLETMTIKVYFNNDKLDPEFSCNKVFPVEREISKTQAAAMAALKELLNGTTQGEKEKGFFTNINSGVKIQSLTIENGVAKVEFDEQLEFQVGGSCKVSAIRAQITETLKQFPTVDSVIISINGRTEYILQP
ncbi:MAG: GerMN domain-containing protein [bacterium]|nr:GerMN domain-containing protein [bacterium]